MMGITPKICRLCVYVLINKCSFESFMCLNLFFSVLSFNIKKKKVFSSRTSKDRNGWDLISHFVNKQMSHPHIHLCSVMSLQTKRLPQHLLELVNAKWNTVSLLLQASALTIITVVIRYDHNAKEG